MLLQLRVRNSRPPQKIMPALLTSRTVLADTFRPRRRCLADGDNLTYANAGRGCGPLDVQSQHREDRKALVKSVLVGEEQTVTLRTLDRNHGEFCASVAHDHGSALLLGASRNRDSDL